MKKTIKMTEKELLKLKKKVDNAEYEEQQLRGQRKAILDSLKEEFNCTSVEEVEEQKKKIKSKIKKLTEEFEIKVNQIKKEHSIDKEYD